MYLCLVGAVVSFVFALVAFPAGTPIVDERVYVQEGRALSGGDLVLPASFAPDHQPFFTAPNDRGELVFKYTHAWPSVLAASYRVFGTERPVTALIGFAGVAVTIGLASAFTGQRRIALTAGALTIVNPLWLVLSSSYLSYAFSACCGLGAVALVVGDGRAPRSGRLLGAGVLAGVMLWARPFDAVVTVLPLAGWWAVTHRHDPRRVTARRVSLFVGGTVPGVCAMLAANRRVTGSMWRLAFDLVGPRDDLGFGPRKETLTGAPYSYGPAEALEGLRDGLLALLRWTPGHLAAVALAAVGVRALPPGRRLLATSYVVAFPVAYLVVWGSWNAHTRLRSADLMGPYYYLPASLVITVLAAAGAVTLASNGRWLRPALALGAGAAASVVVLAPAVESLASSRANWLDRSHELATIVPEEPSVVLLDSTLLGIEPGLGVRDIAYNAADLAGRTVYGIARPERVAPIAERFPNRTIVYDIENYVLPFRLGEVDFVDSLGFQRDRVSISFDPLPLVQTTFVVDVAAGYEPTKPNVFVSTGTTLLWRPLLERSVEISPVEIGSMLLWNAAPDWFGITSEGIGQTVCIGVSEGPPLWSTQRDETCFPVTDGADDEVLAPGWSRTALGFDVSAMAPSDIGDRVVVTARVG